MTIQFVDLRLSNQAASDATPAVIPLAATPLVLGILVFRPQACRLRIKAMSAYF